jgi:hypothetical protein
MSQGGFEVFGDLFDKVSVAEEKRGITKFIWKPYLPTPHF